MDKRYLLKHIFSIMQGYRERALLSGDHFNLFRVIGATSDEVKVHSAFIAELLNPKGSHGQGDIFLKLFLREVKIVDFDLEGASVVIEKYIGVKTDTSGGRLDICIMNRNGDKLIIENKIYAGDQENQLIRYSGYNPRELLYLTLDGHCPDSSSCGQMKEGVDYTCLSYRDDILNWLEECRKEAAMAPLLREGISHYINLIRYLTNQSINKRMNDEVMNILVENPETLRSAYDINAAFVRAKQQIQCRFWKALMRELKEAGFTIDNPSWDYGSDVWKYYNNARNNYWYGVSCEIRQIGDVSIRWRCEIEQRIYTGFTITKNGEGGIARRPEYQKYQDIVKACRPDFQVSNHWLGWAYTDPVLDFKSFNSDEIFQLANPSYLATVVNGIVDRAKSDIAYVSKQIENQ